MLFNTSMSSGTGSIDTRQLVTIIVLPKKSRGRCVDGQASHGPNHPTTHPMDPIHSGSGDVERTGEGVFFGVEELLHLALERHAGSWAGGLRELRRLVPHFGAIPRRGMYGTAVCMTRSLSLDVCCFCTYAYGTENA